MNTSKLKLSLPGSPLSGEKVLSGGGDSASATIDSPPNGTSVELGTSLTRLSDCLERELIPYFTYTEASNDLRHFHNSNRRYANPQQLARISCPHALRSWAYERLPGLGLSYDISNRLNERLVEDNIDSRASLKIVELAEDFLLITRFCRDIQAMQIEINPHAAGIEIIFEFHGNCPDTNRLTIENRGLDILFERYGRENCLKLKPNLASDFIELHVTVFKRESRLGLSPV